MGLQGFFLPVEGGVFAALGWEPLYDSVKVRHPWSGFLPPGSPSWLLCFPRWSRVLGIGGRAGGLGSPVGLNPGCLLPRAIWGNLPVGLRFVLLLVEGGAPAAVSFFL